MSWSSSVLVSQGAWQECAALGHREIDVEHVLLATMQDDAVARLLLRHGVTREGTRQAIDEVVRGEVGELGLDVEAAGPTRRRDPGRLGSESVGTVTMSDRAMQVAGGNKTVAQVLADLIEEPGGTVSRLLKAQGADPAAVLREAGQLAAQQPEGDGADVTRLPGLELLEGEVGTAVHRSQLYAAPLATVWERCATAQGTREWLNAGQTAEVVSDDELTLPTEGISGTVTRRRLMVQEPTDGTPGVVLWQSTVDIAGMGRRHSGPGGWHHLTVTPEGDHATRVDLVSGGIHGRPGWLRKVITRFGQRVGARSALHHLGLEVEGDQQAG